MVVSMRAGLRYLVMIYLRIRLSSPLIGCQEFVEIFFDISLCNKKEVAIATSCK